MSKVTVRKCNGKDLPLLEKHLAAPKRKHNRRYQIQKLGKGIYLIAWNYSEPVGLIEVIFDGKNIKEATNYIKKCADIKYLLVREDFRGKGIGKKLLEKAISECETKGYNKVGLLVDKCNKAARKLYSNYNFSDSGLGDFPGINISIVNGKKVRKKEVANYWVKKL